MHLRILPFSIQCLHDGHRFWRLVELEEAVANHEPNVHKAVESAKRKRETELRLPDEGIAIWRTSLNSVSNNHTMNNG